MPKQTKKSKGRSIARRARSPVPKKSAKQAKPHDATTATSVSAQPGKFGERVNHFNLLRTIEDVYGLEPIGLSAGSSVKAIRDVFA